MNIVSILITLAGIIAILALYIMSKLSQQKRPKDQIIIIPKVHDDDGHLMSSVLADVPATDGSTPPPIVVEQDEEETEELVEKIVEERQIILFIAALNEEGISGNVIPAVLERHNLHFGEMDIFHYTMESEKDGTISLFRIANGVKPWTLVPADLIGTYTPGLSIILQLPSVVNDHSAVELFISHAEGIAKDLGAQLKNAQQENFSKEDKEALLLSVS